MIRQILIETALFLSPFILYGAILLATRGSLVPANWSPRAVAICSVLAVALVAAGLFFFEGERSAPPGSHYVPAEYKDGVFRPGHFE